MKKYFVYLMVALFSVVTFSSCSSSDDTPDSGDFQMVGKWVCVDDTDEYRPWERSVVTVELFKDHTATWTEEDEDGVCEYIGRDEMTWTYNPDTYELTTKFTITDDYKVETLADVYLVSPNFKSMRLIKRIEEDGSVEMEDGDEVYIKQ